MSRSSLKQRILNYLRKHPEWIAKGEIERLVKEKTTYTAENAGRRLRELENEGLVEVKIIKNHAWYRNKMSAKEQFYSL